MPHSTSRWLFLFSILWGAAVFWIAPWPPMADLPQHAGQVALLHDLVTGTSAWSDVFRINLFTPYLVGYGLALPLSFIVPVGVALKIILSLSYIAFVFALVALRRHFHGDPRLDWLFLLSFFGPSYHWGFFTFLAAAPIAVVFILVADRHAQQPSLKRGIVAMLMGLALLLSHGLMFVFAFAVAGMLYALRCRERGWSGRWLLDVWPFMVSGLACLGYFFISTRMQQQYGGITEAGRTLWQWEWKRLPKIFINSLGGKTTLPVLLTSVTLAALPWLLGLRVDRRRPVTWVMFAICLAIAVAVPMFAMATGILYLRFALFTLPAYALMFTLHRQAVGAGSGVGPGAGADAGVVASAHVGVGVKKGMDTRRGEGMPAGPMARRAMLLTVAVTWLMLGTHSWHAWRFGREARDFEAVLAAMAPAQRALFLPFAQRSEAADNDYAYLHFAAWYQSAKQGLVDFNFAWFPPQIARFRPEHLPRVTYGFEHHPTEFDWRRHHGQDYRYFLARHSQPLPGDLFKGADCPPVQLLSSGAWVLFERGDCPVNALVSRR